MSASNYFNCLLCIIVICKVQSKSIPSDDLKMDLLNHHCGVQDEVIITNYNRARKSAVVAGHWKDKTVTYRVLNGPFADPHHRQGTLLSKEHVEVLVEKAFAEWAPHCGLNFTRWNSDHGMADIRLSFVKHHDDEERVKRGQLAYASFPGIGTYAHFNNIHSWMDDDQSKSPYSFVNLYPVVLHEIGHTLGLQHSNKSDSIMYPTINVNHLRRDDKERMRKLYGISEEVPRLKVFTTASTTTTEKLLTTTTMKESSTTRKALHRRMLLITNK